MRRRFLAELHENADVMAAGVAEQIVEAGIVCVRFDEHGVDADGLQIVEPLGEAAEIADAVTVGVLE